MIFLLIVSEDGSFVKEKGLLGCLTKLKGFIFGFKL